MGCFHFLYYMFPGNGETDFAVFRGRGGPYSVRYLWKFSCCWYICGLYQNVGFVKEVRNMLCNIQWTIVIILSSVTCIPSISETCNKCAKNHTVNISIKKLVAWRVLLAHNLLLHYVTVPGIRILTWFGSIALTVTYFCMYREAKQHCNPKSLEESIAGIGKLKSVRCNCNGTKVSIMCDKVRQSL